MARLSEGEPLAVICREDGMPSDRTVREWAEKDHDISAAIARAREAGEDAIAWRLRAVARGEKGASSGDVQRDKLIVDTDLKLLAKFNPKRWGDRQQVEHSGGITLEQLVTSGQPKQGD